MEPQTTFEQLGFNLDQSELLGLMAAVQTSLIIGIDNDKLVPDEVEQQRTLALEGIEKLKRRGLLAESEEEDGLLLLDPNLLAMATALAYPQAFILVTRDEPENVQQQFRYYRANPVHLALEMPAENQYRLIAIEDGITMLNEIRKNLPVDDEPQIEIDSFSLPLDEFLTAKDRAEAGQIEAAADTFAAAGCSQEGARALASAINDPAVGGSIAFLEIENQEVVDGRNLAMVKNQSAAWMVQPREDNPELLQVQTATPADYSEVLLADTRAVI